MITAFEVGSVFNIVDKASPTILRIAKSMGDLAKLAADTKANLQAIGNTSFRGMSVNLKAAIDQATELSASVDKITEGADAASISVANLARAWDKVAASARAASGASMGGGGGGGGRGGFGIRGPSGIPLGGGYHFHGGGGLAGGLLAAIGYGAFQSAQLSEVIAAIETAAGFPIDVNSEFGRKVRRTILQGSADTGLSPVALAKATRTLMLQSGGLPGGERVDMMGDAFRFALVEKLMKGVSPEESIQSATGLMHMVGAYSPEQRKKLLASTAFASFVSPVGLPGIERAASYVLPYASNIMGLDPSSLLLVMAQAQSAGVLSGKSGTWFQGMLQQLSPKGGFALLTKHGGKQHMEGLEKLGLIGPGGELTGLKRLEKNDWAGFISDVYAHLQKIPKEQWSGIILQAMGTQQAARGLATLMSPGIIQRLPELQREQAQFAGRDPQQVIDQITDQDPLLKFQRTWQDVNSILIDIGNQTLPTLVLGLENFDKALHGSLRELAPILGGALAGFKVAGVPGAIVGGVAGATTPKVDKSKGISWSDWWGNIKSNPWGLFGFGGGSASTSAHSVATTPIHGAVQSGAYQGAKQGIIDGIKQIAPGTGSFHPTYFQGDNGSLLQPAVWTDSGGGGFVTSNGVTVPAGSIPSGTPTVTPPMGNFPISGGDAAHFDKIFAGTALQGHWGDVQAAAKANGIPPALMAAIMAHETGRGRVLTYNNVAGDMDPATGSRTKMKFGSLKEGIDTAAKIIAKNWNKAGHDIDKMAGIYAPVGAANDPRGLNGGWAGGVRHMLGEMGANAGMPANAAIDSAPVPAGVLQQAAKLIGNPAALQKFMRDNGYPKSGNWCGEFAASVVHAAGGTPPPGAAIASNWRKWGQPDAIPHVGDIAVRKGVPTGSTGSHVGFVAGINKDGSFLLEGGNQGPAIIKQGIGRYDFRHGTDHHGDTDTAVLPHPGSHSVQTTHITMQVDGRTLGKATMKSIAKAGQGPAQGQRMPDHWVTRPLSI